MKVLHLTLKKKWFDMIASGEKKEEYRELKPYWWTRLGYWHESEHETGYYDYGFNKMPDIIQFKNGYSKDSPTIKVKCENISIGEAKPEWSDNAKGSFFIIELGEILKPIETP
jgi:hypothetical protein